MRAIDAFDSAIARAKHCLQLYDILRDTRKRKVRSDWASTFKSAMRWPDTENIVRIDGKNRDSILVLRESVGLDRELFAHKYVSELLRGAVVAAVSALDRYIHDRIVQESWYLLNRPKGNVPKELTKIAIPVVRAKQALDRLRKQSTARLGHLIKHAIQGVLHRDFTFQKPDDVKKGADILGITDFWSTISGRMAGRPGRDEVIKQLRKIVTRRNQIVHEADLVTKVKAKQLTLRDLDRQEAEQIVTWVEGFVRAFDTCA